MSINFFKYQPEHSENKSSAKPNDIFYLYGYMDSYEPEYKRMYIGFTNDDFTENFLTNRTKNNNLEHHPVHINGYNNKIPGFFVKYTGKTKFMLSPLGEQLCILDDLKDKHVILKVKYKTYNYKERNGWNLTCLEMSANK